MSWRVAESLKTLRRQINDAFPDRDKTSDGSIGDTAHSARKSDHNPNAAGVVTAIDVDENIAGPNSEASGIVAALQASRDPRIKYIIYEKRITVPGDITRWKPYTGPSPHDHHFHISVASDPRLYDDPRPWQISSTAAPAESPSLADSGANSQAKPLSIRTLMVKQPLMQGDDVRAVQNALANLGFMTRAQVDGVYGERTMKAVRTFQTGKWVRADGIVGPQTQKELGL